MKKRWYLVCGIVIGVVAATAGSAFADQVKSLIGKKVTGEYVVVVDGKTLLDKGAIIDGKANAPVREISEALGADVKVEGKKIIVTTDSSVSNSTEPTKPVTEPTESTTKENKYMGGSKASLEELKNSIVNNRIKPAEEERKAILAEINILKTSGMNGEPAPGLVDKEKQLKEYDEIIARATEELRMVEEALAAIK